MDNEITGILQLFVTIAGLVFDPQTALIIGPYLLIAFAGTIGAAWSLGRRESQGRLNALFYFLRIAFTAILLTVAIIKLTAHFYPGFDADWMVAPVALVIGVIGDGWLNIYSWLAEAVKKMANQHLSQK